MSTRLRRAPRWATRLLGLTLGLLMLGPVNSNQLSVISNHWSLVSSLIKSYP